MTKNSALTVSRRVMLGGLLSGVGQVALADGMGLSLRPLLRSDDFRPVSAAAVEALISKSNIGGKTAFVVANARTGQILDSRNPVLGMPPASVAKSITAQYALETLGPTHAFSTRVFASAPMLNGRIDGDLILEGGGDPTLDTNAISELAAALKSTGLREVTGRFLVSGGALPHVDRIDRRQPEHLGYNPAVSGLNLNYNRVHFEWKPSGGKYAVTMDARSDRFRPEMSLTQMEIVDRKFPIYTYANGGSKERWTVAKAALGKGGSRWLPVRQPEQYTGEVFRIFARSHGIVLRTPELMKGRASGVVLVQRHSSPLQSILRNMLKYSTNLTAEVTGLSASVARDATVDGLATSADAMSEWMHARLGAKKSRFVDHSGLGDRTRVTAGDMVQALLRIGPDSTLSSILKPIALRDANGNPRKGSAASLRAKTGTLHFVSGLAGFITAGRTELAFAIFSTNAARRNALSVAERERPPGARGWNNQARRLQSGLIDRWIKIYGG
ncbi:MAG: D-alanyl-D-alanine carboxypeptidase/D-alanyl-D-alanine-endopeptidase [Marinosulfonomonas sp.]|nr:D-alanyl-D-alanine carboxypeptidase/D-alanyl-D-alanine-endopeptidase [Marinosulfonomonas sp.]